MGNFANIVPSEFQGICRLGILIHYQQEEPHYRQLSCRQIAALVTLKGSSAIVLPKYKFTETKALDTFKEVTKMNLTLGTFPIMKNLDVFVYGNNVFCSQ